MRFKSFFIFVITALILSACESSIIDSPTTIDNSTTLAYRGGLNVTFDNSIKEFNKSIRIINQANESYLLDLQLNVKTLDDLKREQAIIVLNIPFTSETGIFPEGNYFLQNDDLNSAYGSYDMIKNNGDFARFNFDGKSATLVIEESNYKYIKGSFIIDVEQLSGKRMTDGQLEDVILSSPIRILSHFKLEF